MRVPSRLSAGMFVVSVAFAVSCLPAKESTKVQSNQVPTESAQSNHVSAGAAQSNAVSTESADDSLVHAASIPASVSEACDSAAVVIRRTLSLPVNRKDGDYHDTPRRTPRNGCRLNAQGSFDSLPEESAGPVDLVSDAFVRRGWRPDLRLSADGPDGSDTGMRRRDILCLVTGRWEGGDDSDTTSAVTPEQKVYQIIVECAREFASNEEANVPDSIWRIASNAGIDSGYAISVSLQSPPYISGDFDGDGNSDAAVLRGQPSTGRRRRVGGHGRKRRR